MALQTIVDVESAVARLRAGGLVALPTETVYGLAGDASSEDAVARIFAAKARPAAHPVIVHLPSVSAARSWASHVPSWAVALMETFWPGPLTVVVPKAPAVLDVVTGGQPTVGLRVPAHPMTLQVLEEFSGGLAAPSANRFGTVSPTTAVHVVAGLGGVLDPERDAVLDGGPCPVGVESTIVGAWDDAPRLLRPGAVTADQISAVTGREVCTQTEGVRTPGSTATHYAPRARVVLVEADQVDKAATTANGQRVALLALRDVDGPPDLPRLAEPADADEYAQVLYSALRTADDSGVDLVLAVLPAPAGLGMAIRDRLRRCADGAAR